MTASHPPLSQASLFIPDGHHQLHLRHIHATQDGEPVLMIHGAIENGKIFYTESGKGLGCFLAEQGFDVYVADMRGRGKSTPSIAEDPNHDQNDQITRDIPMMINFIAQRTGKKVHVICHSWGGVLTASVLARYPEITEKVRSQVCFGTKRTVSAKNFERLFKVELVWKRFSPFIAKRKGYLPGRQYKIGSDDETFGSLTQSVHWVKHTPWTDLKDGFDYAAAATKTNWPPTWHIAAINDYALGHPVDIQRFITETGDTNVLFTVLAKQNGNAMDYDHINMLTHPAAREDHFPDVVAWLKNH